jgi:hypothetical protein
MFESIPAQNIYVCPIGVPSMKYLLSICGAIAAIALAPHNAQASSYSDPGGATIHIYGENGQSSFPRPFPDGDGHYLIKVGSANWYGEFTLPTVSNNGGTRSYTGTFRGSRANTANTAGVNHTCTGTVKIDRTLVAGKYNLKVKWTTTGGTDCLPPGGPHPTLRLLKEALPIANAGTGDFTPTNSTTFVGIQESGIRVWPKWKVVDSTGLNCRATGPGGAIVSAFPLATVINVTEFHPNGTWLKTSSNGTTCYVRANSTYLKPFQLPF